MKNYQNIDIENLTLNMTGLSVDFRRLHAISDLISKNLYKKLNLTSENDAKNLEVPLLQITTNKISDNMTDVEIAKLISDEIITAIKKQL